MFKKPEPGTYTALVTPMHENGSLDLDSLKGLLLEQMDAGVQGVVVIGTTGESCTLSAQEKRKIVTAAIEYTQNKISIIVGTGSNQTTQAVELTKEMDDLGADGFLVVTPYYNKPNQRGLLHYYDAIASATKKPIILYSNPGRCCVEISIDTVAQLHEKHSHICALKDTGTPERAIDCLNKMGPNFPIFSSDDTSIIPFMSVGGHGVISVISNLIPKALNQMTQAILNNNLNLAQKINTKYTNLIHCISNIDTNPIPIKDALAQIDKIKSPEVRSPLIQLELEQKQFINNLLKDHKLLTPSRAS